MEPQRCVAKTLFEIVDCTLDQAAIEIMCNRSDIAKELIRVARDFIDEFHICQLEKCHLENDD